MVVRPYQEELTRLSPILNSWLVECNAEDFGFDIKLSAVYADLKNLVQSADCELLVMESGGSSPEIIGFMGLVLFKNRLSEQIMVEEHLFYVLPEYRGQGKKLITSAQKWAKDRGCTHIIMNASYMASNLCDRISRLYTLLGYKKFEAVYIKSI